MKTIIFFIIKGILLFLLFVIFIVSCKNNQKNTEVIVLTSSNEKTPFLNYHYQIYIL